MTTTQTLEATTTRMFARCPSCKTPKTMDIPAFMASSFFMDTFNGPDFIRCECGRILRTWKQLNAKHNDSVKCDARCTNAKRADCECSCNGANHGSAHLA